MLKSIPANWSVVSALLRKFKWATVAVSFLVLVLVSISVLPIIISSQLQKWLLANGADEVSIENVDFNPFTAKFAIYNLQVKREGVETLKFQSLQASMQRLPLFNRQVVIPEIELNTLNMRIDVSAPDVMSFGGISPGFSQPVEEKTQAQSEWTLLIPKILFSNHQYFIRKGDFHTRAELEKLNVQNLDISPNADAFSIEVEAKLNDSPVKVAGDVAAFANQPGFSGRYSIQQLDITPFLILVDKTFVNNGLIVTMDNKLKIIKSGEDQFTFNQTGSTSLQSLRWILPDIELNTGSLFWDGLVSGDFGTTQPTSVQTEGKLNISELKLHGTGLPANISNQALEWLGKASMLLTSASDMKVTASGKMNNHSLLMEYPQQDIRLNKGRLDWEGEAAVGKQGEGLSVSTQANSVLTDIKIDRLSVPQQLMSIKQLKSEGLHLKSLDEIHLNRLSVEGLLAGKQEKQHVYEQPKLIIDELKYTAQQGLSIKQIMPSGIKFDLYRSKSGKWNFVQFLGSSEKNQPEKKQSADVALAQSSDAAPSPALPIRIEKIVFEDGADIVYNDYSLAEGFGQRLNIKSFEIQNIDNTTKQVSPITLKASLDKASIDLHGNISLFADDPVFELQGKIKALSMLPYSHFMENALGYQVDSGILSADSKLTGKDGKLESETDLTLYQLDIKPLTEEQLKKLGVKQNSGIETGLSMLRDKNNTIKIKLPVNGDFDNLQVDPGDIINQAIGSALKSGAKTYFAAALFPFGTLLVIADAAADKAMQVKLDPVTFAEGSQKLDQKYHEYLQKVAGILEEKPEIHVKICGVASQADHSMFIAEMKKEFLATQGKSSTDKSVEKSKTKSAKEPPSFVADEEILATQLAELATQRASTVTEFLVKKASVDSERLVDCQPRLELDIKESEPRADLLL